MKVIIKVLICILCCLVVHHADAQKKLVVTQQDRPTAFYPESGKACVELISPIKELNIRSTFGDTSTCEMNADELYVYRFIFDLTDESKRTLYISAPGFIQQELKLALSSKQKLFYTVFPPEVIDKRFRFYPGMLLEYVYSGTAMVGGRLSMGKRFGMYVGYKTSLLKEEGPEIEKVSSFYDISGADNKGYIRESYTAGFRMGFLRWMYFYIGGGYGTYGRLWENPDPVENSLKFTSDRLTGPEAELGLSFRMGNFSLSAGVDMLIADEWICDYSLGMGFYINFKKKKKL